MAREEDKAVVRIGSNFNFNFNVSDINVSFKVKKPIEDDYDFTEVLVQDFDDDYHKEKDESMVLYNKARGILNQYSKYSLYQSARDIYDEYMEGLYEKYGGKKYFKRLFKSGLIDEFIPTKPILKKNTAVKKLTEYGIHNSNFMGNMSNTDIKRFIEQANELSKNNAIAILNQSEDPYDIDYDDIFVITDKRKEETSDELRRDLTLKNDSKDNTLRNSDLDAMFSYFDQEKELEEKDHGRVPTLVDLLSSDYDPDDFINKASRKEENRTLINIDGRFVTRSDKERYELKKYLLEGLGIDIDEDRKYKPCYKKAAKKALESSVLRDAVRTSFSKEKKAEIEEQALYCANEALDIIQNESGRKYSSMKEYEDSVLTDIANDQIDKINSRY